jgi:3-hydroxyacyl-CoA dehydrogenase
MLKHIKHASVIGSGVMGSQIACHLAQAGVEVLLLDIVPKEAIESTDKKLRNSIVNSALASATKMSPAPLYSKQFLSRITTGNLTDDISKITQSDWIIEVVTERLDIKQSVFEQIEKHRKPSTFISSNTSGIPMEMMLKGRSEDFQNYFCGTHFFNPPRYLELVELIPSTKTKPEVIAFLDAYISKFLGKKTVICKDTPAFIANRIGVYSIFSLFHHTIKHGLTVEEVDKLTGPILGRPKSATYRTCDVVGLDTLAHVANGLKMACPNDEKNELFNIPPFLQKMLDKGMLGAKTKQGFYKKEGKDILSLNFETLEYQPQIKVNFPSFGAAKAIEKFDDKLKFLFAAKDKAGEFYRDTFTDLFAYISHRIPEISDDIYKIDDAIKAGFGWEVGPFELWDIIGTKTFAAQKAQFSAWAQELIDSGASFYKIDNGVKSCYDVASKSYKEIPGQREKLSLAVLKHNNTLWQNSDASIIDLGDGIINVEFHTKMNTIGGGVLQGINKAIDMAEADYKGVVISNEGQNFSAGANVGLIFMMAVEQDWEELDFAIRAFQNAMMRVRYSSIPVVVAPHKLSLGGGCEMCLHADKVVAHAETYMGLVEFGVGLIPGGGGTKEFTKRLSEELTEGDVVTNRFRNRFLTIGQAKVSTSAYEAFELGYLRWGIDEIVMNRELQLKHAKNSALLMYEKGYTQPISEKFLVQGSGLMGLVNVGANSMLAGNYISEHDQHISKKLGWVMCGGDVSEPTLVTEQYLLDLERKVFLELCMQRKTQERIESILKSGKILRN